MATELRRPWWREPVLHFLLLGGAIFLVDGHVRRGRTDPTQIVVTQAVRGDILRAQSQLLGREPTPAEMERYIADWIRAEALYRESRRLGLDEGDSVVRDRLVYKLRQVEQSAIIAPEPSDDVLAAWLREHRAEYVEPLRLDFEQVLAAKETGASEARARELRERLARGESPVGLGDAFAPGQRHANRSSSYVARTFGEGFSAALVTMPIGEWTIAESIHGVHVVRVSKRSGGTEPTLARLRPMLVRDWKKAEQLRMLERRLDELAAKYHVEHE